VNIEAFTSLAGFKSDIDRMIAEIKSAKPAKESRRFFCRVKLSFAGAKSGAERDSAGDSLRRRFAARSGAVAGAVYSG